MRRLSVLVLSLVIPLGVISLAQQAKYAGPKPPKPDVPYLLHATNLVETEVGEAQESKQKDDSVYTLKGATSPARTPLAEPIFLLQSEKLSPDRLSLYRMEVKNGQRQLTVRGGGKRNKNDRPIFLMVNRLGGNLYRVEVNEYLENGEYCLSPQGANTVYCFTTY